MATAQRKIRGFYKKLSVAFGPQRWWPARTAFEVMVGAILTQNTSWTNVARAIDNLRRARQLSFAALKDIDEKKLARLIRPAGYFNVKARRLKNFARFLGEAYGGAGRRLRRQETGVLREGLLGVSGIGPETADSILLYALQRPVFVVDAYTRRILSRHGLCRPDSGYDEVQGIFTAALRRQAALYNEYHALIVACGKDYCRKTKPRCGKCPLREEDA